MYAEAGCGLTLQSPTLLPSELFARIYRLGLGLPNRAEVE
jgi:hypothetical protein